MKRIAKILPILIAIALVCTALVTVISADSEVVAKIGAAEYTSLEAAFEAAADNATIVLVGDASVNEPMVVNKNVKINLGGFSLSILRAVFFRCHS